jgi:hypothetical protein
VRRISLLLQHAKRPCAPYELALSLQCVPLPLTQKERKSLAILALLLLLGLLGVILLDEKQPSAPPPSTTSFARPLSAPYTTFAG